MASPQGSPCRQVGLGLGAALIRHLPHSGRGSGPVSSHHQVAVAVTPALRLGGDPAFTSREQEQEEGAAGWAVRRRASELLPEASS